MSGRLVGIQIIRITQIRSKNQEMQLDMLIDPSGRKINERLKWRVSMKISMSIMRQHSARNGQDGLLTQEKKLFSEVQLLNLSGESTRAGNIEVELGEVVAIPSRMMNH